MSMCLIDVHWIYCSEKKLHNRVLCGQMLEEDVNIIKFSDLLYSDLIERDHNITTGVQHRVGGTKSLQERIEKDGEINIPATT
jgi:hypothetical protein